SHREQKRYKYNADCLAQVEHEIASRMSDGFGLEIDFANIYTHRLLAFEFIELLPYSFAHSHDVTALHGGDSQADGRPAIVPEQPSWRILVAALQCRDIFQEELTAALFRPNHEIEHVFR